MTWYYHAVTTWKSVDVISPHGDHLGKWWCDISMWKPLEEVMISCPFEIRLFFSLFMMIHSKTCQSCQNQATDLNYQCLLQTQGRNHYIHGCKPRQSHWNFYPKWQTHHPCQSSPDTHQTELFTGWARSLSASLGIWTPSHLCQGIPLHYCLWSSTINLHMEETQFTRNACWALRQQSYMVCAAYKPGRTNPADFLSLSPQACCWLAETHYESWRVCACCSLWCHPRH